MTPFRLKIYKLWDGKGFSLMPPHTRPIGQDRLGLGIEQDLSVELSVCCACIWEVDYP